VDNGWAGVVIHGCIRDAAEVAGMPLGVKALDTHPAKSEKRGEGQRDVPLAFRGLRVAPGDHLYADADGIVVSDGPLHT
jgi:regulator of ribonuclease activity A